MVKVRINKVVEKERIEIIFKQGWLDDKDYVRFEIFGYTKYKNRGFKEYEEMTTWDWGEINLSTGKVESRCQEKDRLVRIELLKIRNKFTKRGVGE